MAVKRRAWRAHVPAFGKAAAHHVVVALKGRQLQAVVVGSSVHHARIALQGVQQFLPQLLVARVGQVARGTHVLAVGSVDGAQYGRTKVAREGLRPGVHAVAHHRVVAQQQHVFAFGVVDYILQLLPKFFLRQRFTIGIGRLRPVKGMGEPRRVEGHQAHKGRHVHHLGTGAAVGGHKSVLAGQLLLNVFLQAAHRL